MDEERNPSPEIPAGMVEMFSHIKMIKAGLYGDPDIPGFEGDIPEIKGHLCRINDRLTKGDIELAKHDASIKVLKDRWKWAKWLIGGAAGGGLTGIGALLKQIFGS